MRWSALILPLVAVSALATPLMARETVEASAPEKLSVTVYRDPHRGVDDKLNRNSPQGFAMISEVRTVTLPKGESTIRFTGVAEGMVAVSAIVTGLPGGTIEKNRNADLLSPAALVDGTLGNRVTITRTNPASGKAVSEQAVVRTRADGGLVLQTGDGFEAVRCSGLPEKLTFDRVPEGLSPQPVFTLDTRSAAGGTFRVTLTYLAWGFDWDANYVGRLREGTKNGGLTMDLLSWLTLVNDNGQSFPDAELMAVAGTLNVASDFEELANPPAARRLSLTCYPLGSTAAGSPVVVPPPPPMAAPAVMIAEADAITVTAMRRGPAMQASPAAVVAVEEELGDLKLYRVPEPITVAAKAQKQVAFLDTRGVRGRFVYRIDCDPSSAFPAGGNGEYDPATILLSTVNEKAKGLGGALPQGALALYDDTDAGELLVGETRLRDYASGQDIELELGKSAQVFGECSAVSEAETHRGDDGKPVRIRAVLTNANPVPATARVVFGRASDWEVRGQKGVRVKDGQRILDVVVPANGRKQLEFRMESPLKRERK